MANTEFPAAPYRLDSYKNYRFRIKWDGQYVAGISRVSALTRTTDVVSQRDGGETSLPHLSPGQTTYAPITLERGVTHDLAFEQWANKVFDFQNASTGSGQDVSLADFRKDITLDLFNEAGQRVISYLIYRCWPSEYIALPDLDAGANTIAIQSITLQNEGWQRDTSVTEPTKPSFTQPPSA